MKILTILIFCFFSVCQLWATIDITVEYNTYGAHPGKIVVVAEGSAGLFSIEVLDESGEVVALGGFSNPITSFSGVVEIPVPVGVYTVRVLDRYECIEERRLEVVEYCDLRVYVVDFSHVVSCSVSGVLNSSCNTGYIHLTHESSVGNVHYTWSARTIDGRRDLVGPHINNLVPGSYSVVISNDLEGCVVELDFQISYCGFDLFGEIVSTTDLNVAIDIPEAVVIPESSSGERDGAIKFRFEDFIDPHRQNKYIWTDAQGKKVGNTRDLLAVETGSYCLSVDNGCQTANRCFDVGTCEDSDLEIIPISPCTDFRYQDLEYEVTGGRPPYRTIEVNRDDKHSVYATDSERCRTSYVFETDEPVDFFVSVLQVRPMKKGALHYGIVEVSVNGGVPPYSFEVEDSPPVLIEESDTYVSITVDRQSNPQYSSVSYQQFVPYTLIDGNGCMYSGFLTIDDCDKIPSFYGILNSSDSGRDSLCTDEHTYTLTDMREGMGPYAIRFILEESYGNVELPWDKSFTIEDLSEPFIIDNLPSGRFTVLYIDNCSADICYENVIIEDENRRRECYYSTSPRFLSTCYNCEFEYSPDYGVFGAFDHFHRRGIDIEYHKDCVSCNNGQCADGELELHVHEDGLYLDELPIIIKWHEGSETTIRSDANGNIIIDGPKEIKDIPPGEYTTYVESQSLCVSSINYSFNTKKDSTIGIDGLSGFGWGAPKLLNEAYFYHYICGGCGNFDGSNEYVFDGDCSHHFGLGKYDPRSFDYVPYDYDNPCDSGGILQAWVYDDNHKPVFTQIRVPPNITVEHFPRLGKFGAFNDNACSIGNNGVCLFSIYDIFGVDKKGNIAASYCSKIISDEEYNRQVEALWANFNDGGDESDDCFFCLSNEKCLSGVCVEACQDGDCASPGLVCGDNGICTPRCSGDYDCGIGKVCQDGICVDACKLIVCPPDYICVDRVCVWAGGTDPCNNVTCSNTQVCYEGDCRPSLCSSEPIIWNPGDGTFGGKTYYHNLNSGDVITIRYTSCNVPDIIVIKDIRNGILWRSDCSSTGSCDDSSGGYVTELVTLRSDNPIRIEVLQNCNNDPIDMSSSFGIEVRCGKSSLEGSAKSVYPVKDDLVEHNR